MTSELEMYKQTFREEAYELLADLETSLLEWEVRPNDTELIGRIFRAMHTIKGSGAMFGFDDITAFTHEVESVLDQVRGGKIEVTKILLDLTLRARDHIKAMVDASDGGEAVAESDTRELIRECRELLEGAAGDDPSSGEVEAPSGADQGGSSRQDNGGNGATFRIRFKPDKDFFLRGSNPLLLLEELRGMGEARIVSNVGSIPELESYESDGCYIYWDIILTTATGINAIKDVFIFVEDQCDLKVEMIDDGDWLEEGGSGLKLGEILTARGDLTPDGLAKALGAQAPLGRVLVESGSVPKDQIQSALVEQQHIKEVREKRQKEHAVMTIRVPSDKLDGLVDLVGEMVTVQAQLSQISSQLRNPDLAAAAEMVERLTAELRDNTMDIRMVPIGTLFNKFRRLVRDLSSDLHKEIEMVTTGSETELDKTVIEKMNDPLVHLIRNSIDHGFETPSAREAVGKPPKGSLRISAEHSGASVLIRIEDDGAGIDPAVIRAKAREQGLIGAEAELSKQEIFQLIFTPGFSTAKNVTDISGRGVGMDVVRRNIESMRGSVAIESELGKGTVVTIKLPLTLAIIDGLLVTIHSKYFVIPVSIIEGCVELEEKDRAESNGRRNITVRGNLIPYIRLRERFGINGGRPEIEQIVICEVNSQRVGIVVDRVIGNHPTVIKALGGVFKNVSYVSGATILGDGSVAMILDMNNIQQAAEMEVAGLTAGALTSQPELPA